MITLKELLGSNKQSELTNIQLDNLSVLLERVNKLRVAYNKPMTVTSGFRSQKQHAAIYKAKGVEDSKIPWGSKHLLGAAVDIADSNGSLMNWLKTNTELLETVGIWCEANTVGWCHLQIMPPKSGSRFFNP